jgi:hypothetical protein
MPSTRTVSSPTACAFAGDPAVKLMIHAEFVERSRVVALVGQVGCSVQNRRDVRGDVDGITGNLRFGYSLVPEKTTSAL